jgi:hypothetical protein
MPVQYINRDELDGIKSIAHQLAMTYKVIHNNDSNNDITIEQSYDSVVKARQAGSDSAAQNKRSPQVCGSCIRYAMRMTTYGVHTVCMT